MKQSNKIKPKVLDVTADLTMCVSRELNPCGKKKKKIHQGESSLSYCYERSQSQTKTNFWAGF